MQMSSSNITAAKDVILQVIETLEAPTPIIIEFDINDPDGDYSDSDEFYDITQAEAEHDEMLLELMKLKRKINNLAEVDLLASVKRVKRFEKEYKLQK